jgi:tRNA 2-thiouridine synthesizing protein E
VNDATRQLFVDGRPVSLDADGFLVDSGQWFPEVAEALAERDGVRLGESHWWLIEFVRDYQVRYGNPPLMRVVVAEYRKRHPDSRGSRELYRLFPEGPVREACRYGGLPKPEWCI